MDPTISIQPKILYFIKERGTTTAKEIQSEFDESQVTIFKHLKKLLEKNLVIKAGTPPKVYYIYNANSQLDLTGQTFTAHQIDQLQSQFTSSELEIFENKFLNITPEGFLTFGLAGFEMWCKKQNLEPIKTGQEYLQAWSKYSKFYTQSKGQEYIDASFKLQESFGENAFLDKLFYLDFYAIERFGKTKLAQLTFQSKQSQDKSLMDQIIPQIHDNILELIQINHIDAVGFIPATVRREVQFMEVLEKKLALNLPKIQIEKVIYDTPVQQKSLKNKNDRIQNATKTFYLPTQQSHSNVLLIDDFVGSGATLNQISEQLKNKKLAKKIYGLGLTGSFKGFEVVSGM